MNYKLYAPAAYWAMSAEARAEIVNGCGPSGWKSKFIPNKILWVDVRRACDIHDFMYHLGQTDADREEADRVFLNNLLRIVEAESTNFFTRVIRRRLVLHFYGAVRDMGGPYFWADKNEPCNFQQPVGGIA